MIEMPHWVEGFLQQLRDTGVWAASAAHMKTTKRQVKKLYEESPEFAAAVDDALELSTDALEVEARRRAVEGYEKGIYFQGTEVGKETVYSDSLLAKFLESKRNEEFGRKQQITGKDGAPLTVVIRKFSEEDYEF